MVFMYGIDDGQLPVRTLKKTDHIQMRLMHEPMLNYARLNLYT